MDSDNACSEDVPRPNLGPKLAIFSGGTAFNGFVKHVSQSFTTNVSHILPISDSGGSTREIIRVLGGPAIGDIRSRLVRLADGFDEHYVASNHVLEYRIQASTKYEAREEFLQVLNGSHVIWMDQHGRNGLQIHSRLQIHQQTLLSFLRHFFDCCERVAIESHREFDYRGGSIGNFVLTGARLFFRSLDCAIHWFSTLAGLPSGAHVLPIISVNERVTLAAELVDGTCIVGQDEISHPHVAAVSGKAGGDSSHASGNKLETANLQLESRILRVKYVDDNADEIFYSLNPFVAEALGQAEAMVYAMGSLYTSIIPSLIVNGIAKNIASRVCPKILILNGWVDRETKGMSAADYVNAILRALLQSYCDTTSLSADIYRAERGTIESQLTDVLVRLSVFDGEQSPRMLLPDALLQCCRTVLVRYISHVFCLKAPTETSLVTTEDLAVLNRLGINIVQIACVEPTLPTSQALGVSASCSAVETAAQALRYEHHALIEALRGVVNSV